MPRRIRERWAIVSKTSGEVVSVRNMLNGHKPDDARSIDPERHMAVKIGGEPGRLLPDDVQPGMVRIGEGFAWPAA